MDKLNQITEQLQGEVDKAARNPFASKVMTPLRLVLVWMNGVNEKLSELEQGGKHG
ncbi:MULTISPECIES: hypothetical protein [Photobacterium]|uniref:hypothetical protein n=1 Tax=Photobacterium TaxID=657 RepID=UPI000A3FA7D8|nr:MULTISPECIES: hypothetical protein [Photobacterium]QSV17321.1 hypothetical protein FH974_20555 [Photobacterium ganghwense]